MSTVITTAEDLSRVEDGATVVVGNASNTQRWVKQDLGLTMDGATLGFDHFATALSQGLVSVPGPPKVGDWMHSASSDAYFRCLRVTHDGQWWAKIRAGRFHEIRTEIPGDAVPYGSMSGGYVAAAEAVVPLMDGVVAQQRLDQVLESGVIPEEREITVDVEITGTTTYEPPVKAAAKTLGVDVSSVAPTQVTWTKQVGILVNTRWKCGCDQVDEQLITDQGDVPDGMTTWSVKSCHE